jgi:hypothetical protein
MKNSSKGFLKGINPSAFLDDWREWHALVEGLCEVLCPWPPRYKPADEAAQDIRNEHHYYMFGRALGILGWLTICAIIKAVLF